MSKEIIKKHITYIGIENPETKEEINVEIQGLKHIIAIANELISRYEQSIAICELKIK